MEILGQLKENFANSLYHRQTHLHSLSVMVLNKITQASQSKLLFPSWYACKCEWGAHFDGPTGEIMLGPSSKPSFVLKLSLAARETNRQESYKTINCCFRLLDENCMWAEIIWSIQKWTPERNISGSLWPFSLLCRRDGGISLGYKACRVLTSTFLFWAGTEVGAVSLLAPTVWHISPRATAMHWGWSGWAGARLQACPAILGCPVPQPSPQTTLPLSVVEFGLTFQSGCSTGRVQTESEADFGISWIPQLYLQAPPSLCVLIAWMHEHPSGRNLD